MTSEELFQNIEKNSRVSLSSPRNSLSQNIKKLLLFYSTFYIHLILRFETILKKEKIKWLLFHNLGMIFRMLNNNEG